jgi:predicted DNA-binding protein (UPF0251 family)
MAGRPKIPRKTCCLTGCSCFKPNKTSKKDFGVRLFVDEIEALDLCDRQNLKQKDAAVKMNISQPTLARILSGARGKLAQAVIKGGEINIG